jgi:tripartite-type tricarboxylate transporter receptor subunit TctC
MAFRLTQNPVIRTMMAALMITFCHASQADATDQLSIIVPLAPGGALDRFARTAERFLPNVTDVDVTVENFSPKKGEDGYREFLDRPADGSTILAWFEPAAAAYEPGASIDDLAIINVQEIEPPILAARRDLGWQNLDEMISAIRQKPSSFVFGIGGRTGGGPLLTSALLENLDLEIRLASYPSGGKARKAVKKGEADFTAGSLSAIRKLGDTVVPLAVFSPRRLRAWPEVPTIGEALGDQSQYAVHGAVYRFYAVRKEFAEREPEEFANLVEAFRRMTEDDDGFKNNSIERGAGALWLGPEDSTSLIRRSNQYFKTLIDNNSK